MITLIASDETTAPLYRVRLLARVLARRYDVQVLGFHFGELDPRGPRDFPYEGVRARPWPGFAADARELAGKVKGRLIYAMKPRPTSYGLALALGRQRGLPVVVDVDDWEPYMIHPYSRYSIKNGVYALGRLRQPNNYLATMACDRLIHRADAVTVVSTHFQRLYGGIIAPQFVDTERFDPLRYDRDAVRQDYGLSGTVIVFAGIALPNKGVGDILEALLRLGDRQDWTLLIVGPKTPYAQELAQKDPRVRLAGTQPPERTPAFLAAADLVVLPQRAEPASAGQMPIKLYEAMGMGLPVVSTGVADIPDVLRDCGLVATPGDPSALAAAIARILDHPDLGRTLGAAARRKVLERYSDQRGAEILGDLFDELLERRGLPKGALC